MFTQAEVQPYIDDYQVATGMATDKFICPLTLHACNLDEISKGHIINEAVGYRHNHKVPVYGEPDHFYGSRVEEAFTNFIKIAGMSGFQLMLAQREINVKFRSDGPTFKAFVVPEKEVEEKRRHLPVLLLSREGNPFYLGVIDAKKGDPEVPEETAAGSAEITWDMRFLPAHWVATMLKAAHLTLFSMIGYRVVVDPSGDYRRRVLARYFYDRASRDDAPNYFRPFLNAVKVFRTGTDFRSSSAAILGIDTLRDRKVICHYQQGRLFAMTLFYELGDKTLSVTIPQTMPTVDIAMATRFYDRLMAEDPELNQTTIVIRLSKDEWTAEGEINMHYEPRRPLAEPKLV